MKNTTTTRTVMTRAWEIRREAAERLNCRVSSVLMSECLRMAWAEAEGMNAADNAAAVLNEWHSLSAKEQYTMMARCVKKAAKNYIGYSVADNYDMTIESPAFDLYGVSLDEYINEAFTKLLPKLSAEYITQQNERRASKWLKPLTLVALVYRAADAGVHSLVYHEKKNGRARVKTVTDSKGNTYDYIDTMATSRKDNTEAAAISAVMLQMFRDSRDDLDNLILDGLTAGATHRRISEAAGISHQAVTKRIGKIREALAAMLSA